MIDELVLERLKELLEDQTIDESEITELSEIINSIEISEFFDEFKAPTQTALIKNVGGSYITEIKTQTPHELETGMTTCIVTENVLFRSTSGVVVTVTSPTLFEYSGESPELNEVSLSGIITKIWLYNFSKIIQDTDLADKITSAKLTEILSDEDFQVILDPQKLSNLMSKLPADDVLNITSNTNVANSIGGENVLSLLVSAGVLSSLVSNYFSSADMERLASDLNSLNTFLAGALNNQLDFANFFRSLEQQFENFGAALNQEANQLFTDFFGNLNQIASGISNLLPPDLRGVVDLGFGFNGGLGARNNTGTFIRHTQTPSPTGDSAAAGSASAYENLNSIIEGTLSQDWRTRNAEPGNPLILEAYRLSGRDYQRDGQTGEYVWNAAFVSWVLSRSGLEHIQTMSPLGYAGYGNPVEIGNFSRVRKNDIIIFNSAFGVAHIGFVREYNPRTNRVKIIGGNQAGTVKLTELPATRGTPELYISHIRRNWSIPPEQNVPLYEPILRPGQQTSGPQPLPSSGGRVRYTPETPAERADRLSGGTAASGGVLL